jgi:hypothetical protein
MHATRDGANPFAPNFGTRAKKSVPFIHYSFAHGVAQPLLQCGEEEQEQEGAKITSTTSRVPKAYSTAALKIAHGFACPFIHSPALAGNSRCISAAA